MMIRWRTKVSLESPGLAEKLPAWMKPQNAENSNQGLLSTLSYLLPSLHTNTILTISSI